MVRWIRTSAMSSRSFTRMDTVYQGGDWAHVVRYLSMCFYNRHALSSHLAWHPSSKHVRRPPHQSLAHELPHVCCRFPSPTRRSLTAVRRTKPKLSTILAHPSLIPRILAAPFVKDAREAYATSKRYLSLECAYMKEQETRPQTLGYSLADSPVGLLAWIYEKLVAWSDDYPWTDDEGKAALSISSWSPLNFIISTRMGLHILVLPCRPRRLSSHILRDVSRRYRRLLPRHAVDTHSNRCLVLSG